MSWIFWAGLSFIIAGFISLAIIYAGEASPSYTEDLVSYSVGWILIGVFVLSFSVLKKKLVKSRK